MKTEERIQKQKELVELIGTHFDKEGFQPIAGRILALLMVMDKEQFTFEEITEELQISKSSASNALRNLELRGDIEYVTLPGDRKRYFQVKKQDAFKLIEDSKDKLELMKNLLNRILELKADSNSSNARFFSTLREVIGFFIEKIDELKEEYHKSKK